jgi:ATP-dependent DNA helicase RecQ
MHPKLPIQVLKQYWGYSEFRSGQDAIIASILRAQDTFALLPTGGGKSLCYQVPALILEGVCLVVSPLIALMQDQVTALRKRGVPASMFYSGLNAVEQESLMHAVIQGEIKILYLSPEKLGSLLVHSWFRQVNWSFLAVDEAHCISQWGHDFRPAYLKIQAFRKISECPVIALTATATPEVQNEICEKLELRNPFIFKSSFVRKNISLSILEEENKADKMSRILKKLGVSSLVYMRNRSHTVSTARYLNQQGIHAGFYHAGLELQERKSALDRWLRDETPVMCCTNAFGMGVDKPDVNLVLHMDLPDSIEEYFQEVGRAGRGGQRSYGVLLYHERDLLKLSEKANSNYPSEEKLLKFYEELIRMLPADRKSFEITPDLIGLSSTCNLGIKEIYTCLRCLEKAGVIEIEHDALEPSLLHFHMAPDQLYQEMEARSLAKETEWIRTILRMYESILDVPVKIHEDLLSQLLGISSEELSEFLLILNRNQLIKYTPRSKATLIISIADPDIRIPDLSAIHELRSRFERRLEYMKDFVHTVDCRQSFVLRYFGENPEADCGICDHCLRKKQSSPDPQQKKKYERKILHLIEKHREILLREMLSQFPSHQKERIEEIILELIGEEKIIRKFDKLMAPSEK